MIVVDASVVIEVLLNTPAGTQMAERFFDPDETIHAPHLLDVEVAQVLRRYVRTGELDAARGFQAKSDMVCACLQLTLAPAACNIACHSFAEDADWFQRYT